LEWTATTSSLNTNTFALEALASSAGAAATVPT
jgi:hypothetical protein